MNWVYIICFIAGWFSRGIFNYLYKIYLIKKMIKNKGITKEDKYIG